MLSYERELVELNAPAGLIARERREVFSIHREVRGLAWAGAMLVATGAGVLVSKNLDRIGPVALTIAIAVAAVGCYVVSVWRRASARQSLIDDYLILLGALLISVDVAYAESQFHLLDAGWPRHFLILAVLHGAAAYVFDSRPVLALSIAALASWLGVEQGPTAILDGTAETGWRALLACAVVGAWRGLDLRFRSARSFEPVFDHSVANLALAGSLLLTIDGRWRPLGLILTIGIAAAVIRLGFRRRSEPFVIYAYAYAVIAIDIVIADAINEGVLVAFYLIVSSTAAIVGLFLLHGRFRKDDA
jgi:hypothetical protein